MMPKFYYVLLYVVFIEVDSEVKNGNCSKCPPGWGVKKACTTHAATECERCIDGETFSSQYFNTRLCWPCSRCGIGLYEARKCSVRKDTVCDDCTRFIYKQHMKNKDFHEKCGYIFLTKSRFKTRKTLYEEYQI